MEVDADVLFKSEAAGSIGSPSFPTQQYLGFNTVAFKIAGTTDTEVKDWELSIDNGAVGHRTLAASQDITEVYAPAKLAIEGGFTIYFANTTERAKFLANTGVAIRMLCEGAVCSTPYKYTIDLNIYDAHYTAFPYGEDQGLLAAQAKFTGHYSTGDAKALQIDVTNLVTAY